MSELGASPESPVQLDRKPIVAAWITFFEHFAKHALLYRTMLGKRGSSWFTAQMHSYIADVIHKRLLASRLLVNRAESPGTLPAEVAVMCVASWYVSVLTWWLENGMAYTPQQMAMWTLRFVTHSYFSALGINVSFSAVTSPDM